MRFNPDFPTKPFVINEGKESALEKTVEKWNDLRRAVTEKIPSFEKSINIAEANKFLREQNIPIAEYIFTDQAGMLAFKDLCLEHGFQHQYINKEWLGGYFAELDLVIINRSLCHERENGPQFCEGIYIHEQAHASSKFRHCTIYEPKQKEQGKNKTTPQKNNMDAKKQEAKAELARVGFQVGPDAETQGFFLEEGWADMLRGKYMSRHMSKKQKSFLLAKNQTPEHHLLLTHREYGNYGALPISTTYPMPAKYLHIDNKVQGAEHITSALPGYGLELLCKKAPELFETLRKARTDVSALRQVPQILDNLAPKLYLRLRTLGYNMEDFLTGLKIILNEVENNPKNRPVNT